MWKRRRFNPDSALERQLRSLRREPRDDFVKRVAQRVLADAEPAQRLWSRAAFAGAVAVFIVGSFASFGGIGYAASGAAGTYHAVKQVAVHHSLKLSVRKSSASAQYPHKPKKKPRAGVGGAGAGKTPSAGVRTSGRLPFTGLSLLATLVLSLALIATGIALRRRERRS